ncbi:STAS domain-containing protein [Streptomyces roseolus]|uniref:STAS domain-containing protein n=1 Tax=Streptomyces roseolus TaxID=67358 RepID=UPI001E3FF863|nr:STAS domain-containing protein [Streptomyces roseolus]
MKAQRCGNTVLIGASGELDMAAAPVLQQALDRVTADDRVLMIDLHGVAFMDSAGLLHLLDLHRRAECLGLRVLVVGWQPQPQQVMARVAGMPGPGSPASERYALAGFRRLIEDRAQRESDLTQYS